MREPSLVQENHDSAETPEPEVEPETEPEPSQHTSGPSSSERFDRVRRTLGLVLGPVLLAVLLIWPVAGLGAQGQALAAILTLVVVYWVTEPIPISATALLGAVLCVILEVAPAPKVFAPFADPLIFLFLGSFLLAEAMTAHGLNRRFAYGILSIPWVGERAGRILFVFGAATAFLSMWISNTATAAMMLPVAIGLSSAVSDVSRGGGRSKAPSKAGAPGPSRFATGLLLMAAFAASAGGIGTPVGTPPNVIGLAFIERQAGVKISFLQWMLLAVPLLAVMYGYLFFLLRRLERPEVEEIHGSREYVLARVRELGPWTRGQINTLAAFGITVTLWIVPGFLALNFGADSRVSAEYTARLPESVAALVGALLLFFLPVDWKRREFTLTWQRASRIDWGTLILFGGGISLGNLMFETKLAERLGTSLLASTGATSLWGITFAAIVISILVSEATSNTAAANMVVPVMMSLALAAGVSPVPPALGATLGASWGFMLPVATPPNAIVYGSGLVPITRMVRAGFLFDVGGAVLVWLGLRAFLPILGLS